MSTLELNVATARLLSAHIDEGIGEQVLVVLGTANVDGDMLKRSRSGDHQRALQEVLSLLYSRKHSELLQRLAGKSVVEKFGDVVGEVLSKVSWYTGNLELDSD